MTGHVPVRTLPVRPFRQISLLQTRVTSIPIFLNARKSAFGMSRSVITSCKDRVGDQRKLRRPNFVESHRQPFLFATSTIPRFTFASSRFGRAQAILNVETIYPEEKDICVHPLQCFFGDGADQGKRILTQCSSGKDHFHWGSRKLSRNIYRVGNNRNLLKVSQGARDAGSRGAGIQNDDLPFFHQPRGRSAMRRFSARWSFLSRAGWDLRERLPAPEERRHACDE